MEAYNHNGEHQPDLKLLVQQYEEMLKNDNISFLEVDSFLMLTDYYEDEDNTVLALKALKYAILQHPFSASLYVRKAQLLANQEKYDLAFAALETAGIYEPSDLDIYLTRADIYMRTSQQDKALKELRIAKNYAGDEEMPDLYLIEATIYEAVKDYDNALKYLKRALRKDKSNDVALSRLWSVYETTRDFADAINFHQNFINENPYSFWAWYNLGLSYMYIGLLEKAAEAFDYAIVINEQFEPAYLYLVDCLMELEEYDEALEQLNEFQKFFEVDAEVLYRIAQCYEYNTDYSTARSYYHKALEISNLNGKVYYGIGNCYVEENEWKLAEKAFWEAYTVDKFNEEFCLALADAYDVLENPDKAHEFYHKAIALAPEEVSIWVHYIEFLIDDESHSIALEIINEARKNVDDVLLDYALAAVLLDSGQRKEGFVVLSQALTHNYDMSAHLFEIAPDLEEDASIVTFISDYKNN